MAAELFDGDDEPTEMARVLRDFDVQEGELPDEPPNQNAGRALGVL